MIPKSSVYDNYDEETCRDFIHENTVRFKLKSGKTYVSRWMSIHPWCIMPDFRPLRVNVLVVIDRSGADLVIPWRNIEWVRWSVVKHMRIKRYLGNDLVYDKDFHVKHPNIKLKSKGFSLIPATSEQIDTITSLVSKEERNPGSVKIAELGFKSLYVQEGLFDNAISLEDQWRNHA
jgi:hypothetical protein